MNYIYKTTNIVTGMVYIGQHTWQGDGLDTSYIGSSGNDHFWNGVKLYGRDKFIPEILEVVEDKSMLDERETYWIQQFFGDNCYNLNPYGTSSWKHSNDVCRQNETGLWDPEHKIQSMGGVAAQEVQKELGVGFCYGLTSEQRIENGKKGADTCKENGTGFFNKDTQQICHERSDATQKELGIGFYGQSREEKSAAGKLGADTAKALGKGLWDPEKKALKASLVLYNWYLKGTDTLVYIGRTCYANNYMKKLNQVWENREINESESHSRFV